MSEKIKKIICCITACCVLIFSCVFCPRQRADAFAVAPVVGSIAGLFALGLLCYGVSSDLGSDFVQDNAEAWASSNGFFSDPTQTIMNTVCASLFLSSVKLYAEAAYSSGACSTQIQGPFKPPEGFTYYNSGMVFNTNFSGEKTFGSVSSKGFKLVCKNLNIPIYFVLDCNNEFYAISSKSLTSNGCVLYYDLSWLRSNLSICSGDINYNPNLFIDGLSFYATNLTKYFNQFSSNGFNFYQYSGTYQDYAKNFVSLNFITQEDYLNSRPVISGACDVFNSLGSLDSYHVDSPGNDFLDFGNLLEKTGCENIDDVVSKVYAGDLSASDVIGGLDCRPYIDVDSDTGTIAIPGETTISRPISLDKDLSIPSDIADTDTYIPLNPPKDDTTTDKPSLPKGAYAFPLADYFPFCLPFDLYKFCYLFVATPKTPAITLDFSTFLPFLDKDNPDQYIYTFDLHSLDKLAEIIRTLELFGIVLGIGLITRRIIGW